MTWKRKKTARKIFSPLFLRGNKLLTAKKIGLVFLLIVFAALDFNLNSNRAFAHKQTYVLSHSIDKTTNKLQQAQQHLQQSQTQYSVNQQQISTTQVVLTQTQSDIAEKEKEINDLNQQIQNNKTLLAGYIQEMSINDQTDPLITFASSGDSLSSLVVNYDQMINVKAKILDMIDQINQQESDLSKVKSQLAQKEADNQQYLAAKQTQQVQVASDIQTTENTISQLKSELNSLQSQLSALLGGGVSIQNIEDAAGEASKATGVRKDYILAELVEETNLGKFTGGCTYKNANMHSYDIPVFKEIMKSLGYGLNDKKVSCPQGYYGGAMGIAQFIPTTWEAYSSQISADTGHNPPNPWNVYDGVMGMALYLANHGGNHKSGEFEASEIYDCGSASSRCSGYASNVQDIAKNINSYLGS